MGSKLNEIIDSNVAANEIMQDIIELDRMERLLSIELSSEDLFRIDSAILSSLRNTEDFSRNLLDQLEHGKFEAIAAPPKAICSLDDQVQCIQQEVMSDITQPLHNMFDEMANLITEVFI